MQLLKLSLGLLAVLTILSAQPVIEVSSSEVTVGSLSKQIPIFDAINPEVSLARAPAPGVVRRVSRIELLRWASSLGLSPDPEQLPEAIVLKRAMRQLDNAEAHQVVLDAIVSTYDLAINGLTLDFLGSISVSVPSGDIQLECVCNRIALNEPTALSLRWREPNGRSGIESIHALVTMQGKWLEAATDLAAGLPISQGDVVSRSGNLPELTSYLSLEQLDGSQVLRRYIKSGQALTADAVRSIPLVSRGDLVELFFQFGAVRLRTAGRAEETGSLGDIITFRNIETGQKLTARLRDKQTAYVEAAHVSR